MHVQPKPFAQLNIRFSQKAERLITARSPIVDFLKVCKVNRAHEPQAEDNSKICDHIFRLQPLRFDELKVGPLRLVEIARR